MRRLLSFKRWPIGVRVTAVFAATMTVVLAIAGLFVYFGVRSELTEGLEESLETQAAAVARLIVERGEARPGLSEGLDDPGETFTQVLGPDGRLLSSTPGLPLRPVLSARQRSRAAEGITITLRDVVTDATDDDDEIDIEALEETGTEPFEERRARVLARQLQLHGRRLTIIVGGTYEDTNEALGRLGTVLLISGPLALLLALLVGYRAVRSALRPVERMRRRAASISAQESGVRLPVSEADDELARLGRTLNEMLARLEEALARERMFVADASHELRTPLAILRAELDVALKGPQTTDTLRAAIRSAGEESQRLTSIAEGLLLLARSDTGLLPLHREPVGARALLIATRERFAARTAQLGRAVHVRADADLLVHGDRQRLEQALTNLIENALRHGAGDIDLTARSADRTVELGVSDQGSGFAPDFVGHAFERFSLATDGRTGPGSGLGLAIVQAIATGHDGSARIDTDHDGARVVLVLPASPV